MPDNWSTDDGYVRLCVAKGTLTLALALTLTLTLTLSLTRTRTLTLTLKVVFCHKPSRTLIVTDLWCASASQPWPVLLPGAGAWGRGLG